MVWDNNPMLLHAIYCIGSRILHLKMPKFAFYAAFWRLECCMQSSKESALWRDTNKQNLSCPHLP